MMTAGKSLGLPRPDTARYLAIDSPTSGRHHVELYNPQLLHPTSKRNAFIWAANDLRQVCIYGAAWRLLCILLVGLLHHVIMPVIDSGHHVRVFFWFFLLLVRYPVALYNFTDGDLHVRPGLGYPRAGGTWTFTFRDTLKHTATPVPVCGCPVLYVWLFCLLRGC